MNPWNEDPVHFAIIDDGATAYVHKFFENQPKSLSSVVFSKKLSEQLKAGPSGNLADLEQELKQLSGGVILAIDFELGFLNARRDEIRDEITAILNSPEPRHPRADEALDSLALVGDQIDGFDIAVRAIKERNIEKLLLIVATSRGNHATFATVLEVVGECLGRTPSSLRVASLHGGKSFSRISQDKTAQGIHAAVKVYHETWGKDREARLVADIWAQQAIGLSSEVFPQAKEPPQHYLNERGFVQKFTELHPMIRTSVDAVLNGILEHWKVNLSLTGCDGAAHSPEACQPAGIAKAISKSWVPLIWILKTWGVKGADLRDSHLYGVVIPTPQQEAIEEVSVQALRAASLLYKLAKLAQHETFELRNVKWDLDESQSWATLRGILSLRSGPKELEKIAGGMRALVGGWLPQEVIAHSAATGTLGASMQAIATILAENGALLVPGLYESGMVGLSLKVRSGLSGREDR